MPDTPTPARSGPTALDFTQSATAGGPSSAPQPRTPVQVQLPGMPPTLTDTVYISFSAEIVPKTAESLIGLLATLANQKVPHVYMLLSTPGGAVMSGLNLYNVLRGMPFELTAHNVGNVDSIGNAIFLAGAKRYACPHSTFMFHGVGFDIQSPTRLEEKFLRERLDGIDADQRRIGAIIEDRTQLSGEQVKGLFLEASTKDAAFAVGCGIVHEIRDVQIPLGGPVVSLVFQR
jgi:ATP-dependent Clp protease, protease subunit